MSTQDEFASVRYVVEDVQAALDFYTGQLGFTATMSAAPAFAEVVRGRLWLLLSGPASSGAKITPPDVAMPGRNRIHLIIEGLDHEVARLKEAGLAFRTDVFSGPGGRQILLSDPAGNLVELFEPAARPATS